MTAYYTDGTDFKTGNSNETIQVALNSVLVTKSISDRIASGGLTTICTQRDMVTTLAVYRVTDNFEIA